MFRVVIDDSPEEQTWAMECDKRRLMDHLIMDDYSAYYGRWFKGFLEDLEKLYTPIDPHPRVKCWQAENQEDQALEDITCDKLRIHHVFTPMLAKLKLFPWVKSITTS